MDLVKNEKDEEDSSIMYIGHLPYGFYEKEIFGFFSQFGKVLKVRVSRNPKTGKDRGFAFLKFEDEDVAKIAAGAMDNKLVSGKIIKCKILKKSKVHPNLFFKYTKKVTNPAFRRKLILKQKAKPSNSKSHRNSIRKTLGKLKLKKKKIEALGLTYDFPTFTANDLLRVKTGKIKKFKI
eukprot:TRINITY_DN740_c3_g1_i2.p1 TRINITY_DN740_c3_g1~~TRINITY_DN740_c3_g1_i2.p1  ORF type:complete len:179 (-),score=68.27 TRINITY_DN740_c3_g1_i2:114-650(-)